jgi:hypothetical protein
MRNKTPRFSSSKEKTSVVKITGGVWDEFHREMTPKLVPSDRCNFVVSLCACILSVRITFRIQKKYILLYPQTNAGPTTFLLISLVLFHLLLSLRKESASNHGREAGYTSCDSS